MSKIEEFIQKFCPNGVEYKALGEVLISLKTGLNPRKFFKLNTPDAKNYYVTIREIKGGFLNITNKTDRINDSALALCNNRSNLSVGDVLFSGTGTIGETYVIEKHPTNWNIKEGVYALKPNPEFIDSKYLKYILNEKSVRDAYLQMAEGGTVKSVSMKGLNSLEIPFPPVEVQKKIVRILDKFTALSERLNKELELRKKQYEYYRDILLNRSGNRILLGDIGKVCMCKRIMKNQTNTKSGIPFFKIGTFGGTADAYIPESLYDEYRVKYSYPQKGDILISASGTIGRRVVYNGEPAYFQDSNIIWIDNNETIVTNRFLYYLYEVIEWKTEGGTIKRLYNDNLKGTEVVVPSLSEQERIVSILDKFDTLINDQEQGLPAEIRKSQQQYEYYRDKLLTF